MGLVEDFAEMSGYEARAIETVESVHGSRRIEASMNLARSWAGLTSQGRILISVEQLAHGQDVQLLLAHETAHDVLLHSSVFGWQQLALSVFAEPPWPPGILRRTVRRVLATSVSASRLTQEGCATFLPALSLDGARLAAYWATVPAAYRKAADPLAWLRDHRLPREAAQRLVFALGEFALGVRMPAEVLGDERTLNGFLSDPANNPDQRFASACTALAKATRRKLTALVKTREPATVIAERWYPRIARSIAPYEPDESDADTAAWWERIVVDMANVWAADSRLSTDEREELLDAAGNSLLLMRTPTYPVLKAGLMRTVSAAGAVWDHPPVDWLLPYELVELSYNFADTPVPGIEMVDGSSLPLQEGEAAVWLTSPHRHSAAARLSAQELRQYLTRATTDTTLCVDDASYWFPWGDTLADEPMLRGRPHLVLIQQRPLGVLLKWLGAFGEIAGERTARYAVIGGETPGVSYFLIGPATARYPIIVAPVPQPTAERAKRELAAHGEGTLRWTATTPIDFLARDVGATIHLLRLFAWYEDKPWPPQTTREEDHLAGDVTPKPSPSGDTNDGGETPVSGDVHARNLDATARAAFARGRRLLDQEDLEGAKKAYIQVMDTGHDHLAPLAALDLGHIFERQDDLKQAKDFYQIAMDSGHSEAGPKGAFGVGITLRKLGNFGAAKEAYEQAVKSGHSEVVPHAALDLGGVLNKQGDFKGAKEAYELAVKSGDSDVAPKAAFNLGMLLEEQGNLEEAIVSYQEALVSGHDEAARSAGLKLGVLLRELNDSQLKGDVLNKLGKLFQGQGRLDEASAYYWQSLSNCRQGGYRAGEAAALTGLGDVHADLRRFTDAIRYYEWGLIIYREIGDRRGESLTLLNIGTNLERTGKLDLARARWQDALAILTDLGMPEANQVRSWLKKGR